MKRWLWRIFCVAVIAYCLAYVLMQEAFMFPK